MIMDIIQRCAKLPVPASFYCGLELPENFFLPDNILMFAHDWYPLKQDPSDRYKLVIPTVPLVYELDDEAHCEVNSGNAILLGECQQWHLHQNHPDLWHGYMRLIVTFEVKSKQFYLPGKEIFVMTPQADVRLKRFSQAYFSQDPVSCSIALFELLCELSRHPIETLPRSMSLAVRRAIHYINASPCHTGKLSEIAAHSNSSASNLRRQFRRETGTSIGRFVLEHRLKTARHYLTKTTLPLAEIAEICGFQSVYSFCHFFSRNEGVAPGRYRQKHCGNK